MPWRFVIGLDFIKLSPYISTFLSFAADIHAASEIFPNFFLPHLRIKILFKLIETSKSMYV